MHERHSERAKEIERWKNRERERDREVEKTKKKQTSRRSLCCWPELAVDKKSKNV